jgi:hypothetical protein
MDSSDRPRADLDTTQPPEASALSDWRSYASFVVFALWYVAARLKPPGKFDRAQDRGITQTMERRIVRRFELITFNDCRPYAPQKPFVNTFLRSISGSHRTSQPTRSPLSGKCQSFHSQAKAFTSLKEAIRPAGLAGMISLPSFPGLPNHARVRRHRASKKSYDPKKVCGGKVRPPADSMRRLPGGAPCLDRTQWSIHVDERVMPAWPQLLRLCWREFSRPS